MLRHRLPGLRPVAVLLATALTGAWTMARAEPAPQPSSEGPEQAADDPLAEAQALYERGRAKFETADYSAAIELWSDAYALVPDDASGGQIKTLLLYNIATARERAFEVSRDPAQLRQARILMEDFEQGIDELYGEGPEAEAERRRVHEKIAALDERIAEHEQTTSSGSDTAEQPEPEPSAVDPGTDEPATDAPGRGLVIGGAVSLSLGAAGLGMMAAGLGLGSGANDISDLDPNDIAARRDRFDRGRTGNALAIAGGVTAGVLVVTGSVLLALGLRRNRNEASAVALQPSVGPQGAGLVLRGRF
ncbi:MAG: hypothetical protein AB1Z98_33450 [Nannocystaceae bacterium]